MTTEQEKALRSANMAQIRGKNTTPELTLRRALWKKGLRYRIHLKVEGVRPDIAFPSKKMAIFVDGCFWHGCPLHYVRPRSKSGFWATKLADNTKRDRSQTLRLVEKGWSVLRFWEHEVETELERVIDEIVLDYRCQSRQITTRPIVVRVDEINSEPNMECWYIEDLFTSDRRHTERRSRRARSSQ